MTLSLVARRRERAAGLRHLRWLTAKRTTEPRGRSLSAQARAAEPLMFPSLLANDIQTGLKQFLVTAFEPSDEFFHGLLARFVENEAAWMKGPFLHAGLPFRPGPAGRAFFEGFETQNPSYTHQEKSWQRLVSRSGASNTIVATGTGSGKTECFLYPVLDDCARALKAGDRGVKALVIYPMNALATDQARRF